MFYFFDDFNFFNYSKTNEYKLFIHKNNHDNIKLLFYDFEKSKNIKIISNEFEKQINLEEWDYVELPFNNCSLLKICYNNEEIGRAHV